MAEEAVTLPPNIMKMCVACFVLQIKGSIGM